MSFFVNSNSTLFLDRDGVVNRRIVGDYVRDPKQLELLPKVPEALFILGLWFRKIVLVTNQQGIGKGWMSEEDLSRIHVYMRSKLMQSAAVIHQIHFCSDLANKTNNCRKPYSYMALQAQKLDPLIDFQNAVMVGDMASDIMFGQRLGMRTVFIGASDSEQLREVNPDWVSSSLWSFALAVRHGSSSQ